MRHIQPTYVGQAPAPDTRKRFHADERLLLAPELMISNNKPVAPVWLDQSAEPYFAQDKLVGYWPLSRVHGYRDISSSGTHLVEVTNSPTWSGNDLIFTSAPTTYLNGAHSFAVGYGSMVAIVRTTYSSFGFFATYHGDSTSKVFGLLINSGKLGILETNTGSAYSHYGTGVNINDGKPHVVGMSSNGSGSIWVVVDGQYYGVGAANSITPNVTDIVQVGNTLPGSVMSLLVTTHVCSGQELINISQNLYRHLNPVG